MPSSSIKRRIMQSAPVEIIECLRVAIQLPSIEGRCLLQRSAGISFWNEPEIEAGQALEEG